MRVLPRAVGRELSLHQVFRSAFFPFSRGRGGVGLDRFNSALGEAVSVCVKIQGCFVGFCFYLSRGKI